jgi:hypothetical protein
MDFAISIVDFLLEGDDEGGLVCLGGFERPHLQLESLQSTLLHLRYERENKKKPQSKGSMI